MFYFAEPVARLIAAFMKMPTVGPRTAQRLAFYVIGASSDEVRHLADAMLDVKAKIRHCVRCFNLTESDLCRICEDPRRDAGVICVVSDPRDIAALEKAASYTGAYHVLGGALSPMDGIGPDQLTIKELLARLHGAPVQEIIVATNPDVNGEATALYIARLVKPFDIPVTRLASGLPMGADLEYADEVTLARALEGRRAL